MGICFALVEQQAGMTGAPAHPQLLSWGWQQPQRLKEGWGPPQ